MDKLSNHTNQIERLETQIPDLLHFKLPLYGDERGWFKENWQKQKFIEAGVPKSFEPVQNNISYNKEVGVTRGIHAEPWNKFISIAKGSVFAAIVDLRDATFGRVETFVLTPADAIYVPKGMGNSFQTLAPDTIYTYLVDDVYTAGTIYPAISLGDPDLGITWPKDLERAIISEKDQQNPSLKELFK